VTFGDVSAYRVRRIGGVRIERDDSVYFTQFESVVRFAAFMDADLFDTAKVKALTLAA
jgi:chromosome condensin MukBEF MukE localization factor